MAKKPAKAASESSSAPAPKKKAAPKGGAKPAAAPTGAPQIDTNLAANAAAAFVARKLSMNQPASPRQESAGFKNLKESLAKPSSQGLSNILDNTSQNKKPINTPYTGKNQVAHNQTYGADVSRSGVPRRTPG
ncbi:MAG TPA: hypothetical protein VF669_23345 [Tepidisphaeraceae bacterium]|jgi:hypothetical protein